MEVPSGNVMTAVTPPLAPQLLKDILSPNTSKPPTIVGCADTELLPSTL